MDEVGRGCLAGPVFAGAVILPADCVIPGINDSKQLLPEERDRLFHVIRAKAVSWSVASVTAETIDEINIHYASLKAMAQAISRLVVRPEYLLIDGRFTLEKECLFIAQEAVVRGDGRSQSIAAASIMAKVCRDRWIAAVGRDYPGFTFHQHKGYATPDHRREIATHGMTPLHRKSFRCLKDDELEED